ncbi:GTP-binding protein [Grosmannia clavigera kw1407]|uniref:GTP-binding protein n=1 Tax=Grosmannia clavigera (strain kw1407 / UAMH 11150) TaxID=655863 RepID=F0X9X2_GROCL|nr:GTP-binding protein [Grosmannia clavigera kw1407]EFX05269.1 GTP-binding protein [Grosmannia clavigera kw1407]
MEEEASNVCSKVKAGLQDLQDKKMPSVRYAAIAQGLIYRNYVDADSSNRAHQLQLSKDWLPDKAPLFHYNRAIQLLLNQENGDNTETIAITLLVCYLFTCFDHLAGNHVRALKHLQGGVELSRNADIDARPSAVRTLIYQVSSQIRRLDMQAETFLVDWTPADIQEILASQLPSSVSIFQSVDQAADHLQILVARVMRLHNSQQQLSTRGDMSLSSSFKVILLEQLETWLSLFENMLPQGSSCDTSVETYPLISLLRLQHTIAWTLLASYGPGGEMCYDSFLPQFQRCVALAGDIAAAHERYSGSIKPTFTPEIGIAPVLYIIGVKCRQRLVRREALSILQRRAIREAVWDSTVAAKVVERVIEIEEGGIAPTGGGIGGLMVAVARNILVLIQVYERTCTFKESGTSNCAGHYQPPQMLKAFSQRGLRLRGRRGKSMPSAKDGLKTNVSLESLQTDEQRRILDTVSKVRKCGLDRVLSLPQIVVCGDQSSGKSSLLEALTEIPFPRNDNLCTRFATEISLRREPNSSLTIRIIPDSNRSLTQQNAMRKFSETITNFEDMPDIMGKAMNAMGISSMDNTGSAFARLIQASTKGVSEADVAMVAEITDSYIKQPRTICLAVVSATNDAANQPILQRVRKFDPQGERTLGVITKPDRLSAGSGSETKFLELARNGDVFFKLGWHDDVGIDALRVKLSHLLVGHSKKELPRLQEDLDLSLSSAYEELKILDTDTSNMDDFSCEEALDGLLAIYKTA